MNVTLLFLGGDIGLPSNESKPPCSSYVLNAPALARPLAAVCNLLNLSLNFFREDIPWSGYFPDSLEGSLGSACPASIGGSLIFGKNTLSSASFVDTLYSWVIYKGIDFNLLKIL